MTWSIGDLSSNRIGIKQDWYLTGLVSNKERLNYKRMFVVVVGVVVVVVVVELSEEIIPQYHTGGR